jgi:predicted CXXCH cytochrome family protein
MAKARRRGKPKSRPVAGQSRSPFNRGPPDDTSHTGAHGHALWIAAAIVAVLAVAAAAAWLIAGGGAWRTLVIRDTQAPEAAASFVGSEACAGCHQAEAKLWRTSQHKHAMDHATDTTVRGDFNDATFTYFGVTSRFFRKDGKFLVETDGADGKLAVFDVKYTFGVDPLQQYLIEFPDGRIQALSIAWDTRPKDKGGQRWFHLYPSEEIRHDDVLHWTKLNQNWNFMCAECHSTGVKKNYDAAHDRFATTWSEISVGCEACHGAGSRHEAWARGQRSWLPFGREDDPAKGLLVDFGERRDVTWSIHPQTGNATRTAAPATLRKEVETCGLCHARRSEFSESWIPGQWLSDTHVVSPLARSAYSADGQMRDEVYNYGSFKQSKMFAKGVTCGDCHEPHSATLRAPGDGVCLQCHDGNKYAAAAHNNHAAASPALTCASCHMPERTYMVVDKRHDHSFRIPRPDISVKLGTPNACNDCHKDKSAEWAAAAVARWHGPDRKGFQTYAEAFHAAWSEQSDAATLLAKVAGDADAPAFARASALSELGPYLSPANAELARAALADPDPMVRIGALDMLEGVPGPQLWPLVSPLLSDPIGGVRIRTASLLASVPSERQPATDRGKFERAAAEFITAQQLNADRPEARTALATFYARRGRAAEAEAEFKAASRLSPQFAPAAVNLADLYRQVGRFADGAEVLRTAIAAGPRDAGLHHALGLALVRLKRNGEALAELRTASELDPERARYAYVYAVALQSSGRLNDALATLKESLSRHPNDRDTLMALVSFSRDGGDAKSALAFAERLARLAPGDRDLAAMVETLRRQAASPGQ